MFSFNNIKTDHQARTLDTAFWRIPLKSKVVPVCISTTSASADQRGSFMRRKKSTQHFLSSRCKTLENLFISASNCKYPARKTLYSSTWQGGAAATSPPESECAGGLHLSLPTGGAHLEPSSCSNLGKGGRPCHRIWPQRHSLLPKCHPS